MPHIKRKVFMDNSLGFSGSYHPDDVVFLLNKKEIQATDVVEKEKLIQSGKKHYSQMISVERPPSNMHMNYYQHAMDFFGFRMADEIQLLGNTIIKRLPQGEPIVLVSLVRAGVPVGVLLKRHIQKQAPCFHYAISIVRDRGIDFAALQLIINRHGAKSIVFVDGWTGKGAISKELTETLQGYPDLFEAGDTIPRLVTLADLGGCSWLAASADDWIIPSGILNSVVSGLVSRSILDTDYSEEERIQNSENPEYWHSCIEYKELKLFDVTNKFVDDVTSKMFRINDHETIEWTIEQRNTQKEWCLATIDAIAQKYEITNLNRIKPGIAEATRAVMRRVPELILVKTTASPHIGLLCHLGRKAGVEIREVGDELGPYEAVTLIKKTS